MKTLGKILKVIAKIFKWQMIAWWGFLALGRVCEFALKLVPIGGTATDVSVEAARESTKWILKVFAPDKVTEC